MFTVMLSGADDVFEADHAAVARPTREADPEAVEICKLRLPEPATLNFRSLHRTSTPRADSKEMGVAISSRAPACAFGVVALNLCPSIINSEAKAVERQKRSSPARGVNVHRANA